MRKFLILYILILGSVFLNAQSSEEKISGSVSYVTSQNVYVKFSSTAKINIGDTLYILENEIPTAVLKVNNLSSISCVCTPLTEKKLAVSNEVFVLQKKQVEAIDPLPASAVAVNLSSDTEKKEISGEKDSEEKPSGSKVRGRVSVASYLSNSNEAPDYTLRMRYTFSLNVEHINNSKVSMESYFAFTHRKGAWDQVQENIYNGLKVYNLAVNYDLNETTEFWLGRKINRRMSNVGAIDGLQMEKRFGNFTGGIVVGSRPDWKDYSLNTNLFQVGTYLSHDVQSENGKGMQSTVAFMEQKNNWNSDRRFLYFQHSNWLLKNLYFFGSGEFDLYKKVGDAKESTFDFTNLYASLRYQVFKPLRISLSYSARNNIIYYETYKDIIDRLLDTKTLQGYSLSVNYRPFKKIAVGARGGYRFRDGDPKPSKNLYTYITYSQIPFLKVATTVYATFLETNYINSNIYGIRLNRDIVPGKLYGGLNYRYAAYSFTYAKNSISRNTIQLDLNYRIIKTLNFSVNYEYSIEGDRNYNYFYLNLTKRFK